MSIQYCEYDECMVVAGATMRSPFSGEPRTLRWRRTWTIPVHAARQILAGRAAGSERASAALDQHSQYTGWHPYHDGVDPTPDLPQQPPLSGARPANERARIRRAVAYSSASAHPHEDAAGGRYTTLAASPAWAPGRRRRETVTYQRSIWRQRAARIAARLP